MRRFLSAVLMPGLFLVIPEVARGQVDSALEVARIENASQARVKELLKPLRLLEEKFKAALGRVEVKSRQAGEMAAVKAAGELEAGTLAPGRIEHPEVSRLAKIFFEEKRKLLERAAPGLKQANEERMAALQNLAERLKNAGMFQDAKVVAAMQMQAGKKSVVREAIGFLEIPASMRFRKDPAERERMVVLAGGAPQTEEAVLRGLRYLKSTQNADGSWTAATPCAMTGFALLALLGHGETPGSPEFGECCRKAIDFLVNHGMKNNGLLTSSGEKNFMPYEQAIATQALAEALIFCVNESTVVPNLREMVAMAGQFIISNQHESGGWDYGYNESGARGGDLSIASWQIGALNTCKDSGIDFKNITPCIGKALDYVEARQGSDGGFGYSGKGDSHSPNGYHTLTGAGMLCLQLWGKGSSGAVRNGANYLAQKSRFDFNGQDCDLYGHYFEALALRHRGAEDWKLYQARVMPQLIENQEADGSWKVPGGGMKPNAVAAVFTTNAHYRACLCLLMLESYYRIVPE